MIFCLLSPISKWSRVLVRITMQRVSLR